MVYLSRIYTKTGDDGETALGDGTRVGKDHPRVAAYGAVDELNAVLGVITAQYSQLEERSLLESIQNDLFDVGADLCVPIPDGNGPNNRLRVQSQQVTRLEKAIDRINAGLKPLTSFILPGGSPPAAWLHLARTVCRRAERDVVELSRKEKINSQSLVYLNRLSDLLFVMSRSANQQGGSDVLWQPGLNRDKSE